MQLEKNRIIHYFRPSLFTIHYFFAHYSLFIIKKRPLVTNHYIHPYPHSLSAILHGLAITLMSVRIGEVQLVFNNPNVNKHYLMQLLSRVILRYFTQGVQRPQSIQNEQLQGQKQHFLEA